MNANTQIVCLQHNDHVTSSTCLAANPCLIEVLGDDAYGWGHSGCRRGVVVSRVSGHIFGE